MPKKKAEAETKKGSRTGGAKKAAGKSVKIQWYRSTIGSNARHKVLVRSLGFTKLNQIVERPDTPSMRGMVAKAPHLLRIVE